VPSGVKRNAYMNKNELEYYNIVCSNAIEDCERRHDCEVSGMCLQHRKRKWLVTLEDFYRAAWGVTKKIKVIEM